MKPAIDTEGEGKTSSDGSTLFEMDNNTLNAYVADIHYAVTSTIRNMSLTATQYGLDLSQLSFSDEINLVFNSFPTVNFRHSIFEKGAVFSITQFQGDADFSDTIFRDGHCTFTDSTFGGIATFDRAIVPFADFSGVRFEGYHSSFKDVTFLKGGSFAGAKYSKATDFTGSKFNGNAHFANCQFQYVNFSDGCFGGIANYNNSTFEDRVLFDRTVFTSPPWFHQSDLHQDTSFYNSIFQRFETVDDWRAYRTLKLLMGQFRAHEEEGRFFEYEQRSRCNILIKENYFSVNGNISKLYDILSKYGESIGRPIVLLIASTTYFWLLYFLEGGIRRNPNFGHQWTAEISEGLGLALQNVINPLSFFSRVPAYYVDSPMLAGLSVLQSITSVTLIALTFLAIRRRFHKSGGQ